MARTIDQQIASTQAKLARLKTRQKASETRRKIIVGAIVTSAALKDQKIARWMAATLRKNATREVDQKELVGLASDRDQMARSATQAATRAAESAMAGFRHDLDNERAKLSQAAGEARREAWRWFGGFWVWLASMLATGAVIGALAMAWIQGRGDAREFGQFPSIYCGTAGGQVVEQDNGSSYCAIWINKPDQ